MFGLPSRSRLAALLPLSITLPLVAAACGDDGREDSESGTASNTDPATTDSTATNSGSETETTMGPGGSDSTSDTGTTFDVTTDDPSVTETITASDPTTTTEGGCDASDQCDVGELCIMGECAPAGEPCDTNADCEGDTYCCKEGCLPPGEEPGTCLPWPDGDFDGACEGEPRSACSRPRSSASGPSRPTAIRTPATSTC